MTDNQPNSCLVWFIIAALFIGGALLGIALAYFIFTPQSTLGTFVSLFIFPTGFVLSMFAWQGVGLISLISKVGIGALRKRSLRKSVDDLEKMRVPPGKIMLLLFPIFVSAVGGLIMVLLSPLNWLLVVAAYTFIGLIQGTILYILARIGWINTVFIGLMEEQY